MGAKRFTRMNNLGHKLSKIDRILVSQHVIDFWPSSHTVALPREFSDHAPILLSNMTVDFGASSFKLYNSCLSHKYFPQLVKDCWTSRNVGPIPLRPGNSIVTFKCCNTLKTPSNSGDIRYVKLKIWLLLSYVKRWTIWI